MFKQLGCLVVGGFLIACSGETGAEGSTGASALMSSSPELPGASCPTGGEAITVGVDKDSNGKLDETEITSTSFVCNGSNGSNGSNGAQGQAGSNGQAGAAAAKGDPGAAGADGTNGVDGKDGANGTDGTNGTNGADGADGAQGAKGDPGATGAQGIQGVKGDPGAPAKEPTFGVFVPSQVVHGAVVACTSVDNSNANNVSCSGMTIDGLPANLTPQLAGAICNVVTGKGYLSASGLNTVPVPYMNWDTASSSWKVVATGGNVSPASNVTCSR